MKFQILGVTSLLKGRVLHAGLVRPSVWDLLSEPMLLDRFSLNLTLETSIKSSEDLIFNCTDHKKAK